MENTLKKLVAQEMVNIEGSSGIVRGRKRGFSLRTHKKKDLSTFSRVQFP